MGTKTYDYRPKTIMMMLNVVIMAVSAAGVAWIWLTIGKGPAADVLGASETRGAVTSSDVVFLVLFLFCAAMAVIGLIMTIKSLEAPKQVVLGPIGIEVPKSIFGSKTVNIPYAEISELKMQWIGKQNYIIIKGRNDKIAIAASMIRDKDHFADLMQELQRRCA